MNISCVSNSSYFSLVDVNYLLSNKCNAFAVYSHANAISYSCDIIRDGVGSNNNKIMNLPDLKVCRVLRARVSGRGAVSFNNSIFSESLQNWINDTNAQEHSLFIKNKYQLENNSKNNWSLINSSSMMLTTERPTVLLSTASDNEFFHFIFESLSKIHIFNSEQLNNFNWMINDNAHYQVNMLLNLGIHEDNIYVKSLNEDVIINDLIFIQPPANNHRWITPDSLAFLRKCFLCENNDGFQYEKLKDFIYMSKKDEVNGRGFIFNFDVVKYFMNSIGIVDVDFDDDSFLYAVKYIERAKVIISDYRAGSLMMFLAHEDSKIICFQSPTYFRDFPHFLAELIGFECVSIVGNDYNVKNPKYKDCYTIRSMDLISSSIG